MKRHWYYRGSLKSCNYSCSYCPFSKRKGSVKALQEDKEALFRFVEKIEQENAICGAVQIVPYGEALIHSYYWEALARLSQKESLDAIGAQSNFSFPVEKMLDVFCENGGRKEKLRLWGTFHPEMVTVEKFVEQCKQLFEAQIKFSVGVVGVPENLGLIQEFRSLLPDSIYLWVNKMDGLKRKYTQEEIDTILEVDEYFELELRHHKSDVWLCGKNRFVEANGTMRRCNICPQQVGNFYTDVTEKKLIQQEDFGKTQLCTRKECSCFLSYCNQNPEELLFFQPYPAFRIPSYPKAIFLDIDGTLIPEGEKRIPENYVRGLFRLAKHSKLYFATSLPYEIARQRTREIWRIMDGGVFANGGRCVLRKNKEREKNWDEIEAMDRSWIEKAKEKSYEYGYTLHTYCKGKEIYKVTLVFSSKYETEIKKEKNQKILVEELGIPETCQFLLEENCFQITKKGTGKLEGVLKICEKMGYKKQDVMVAGDSENDIPMLQYFPNGIMVKGS